MKWKQTSIIIDKRNAHVREGGTKNLVNKGFFAPNLWLQHQHPTNRKPLRFMSQNKLTTTQVIKVIH